MTDRFSLVPAAYVFFLRDGESAPEVLLQLRRNTGYMDDHWAAAAAGHIEPGETADVAAHREALEELGVTDIELEFLTSMQRSGNTGEPIDERIDFFFKTSDWSGDPRIVEPEKCAGLDWFSLDGLPDPVVPHELKVLTALRQGSVPAYTSHGF